MTDQEIARKFAAILQDAVLEIDPTINFRWQRMFGGAGYYADDRMFAGWFGGRSIALKLSAEDRDALLQIDGAREVSKHYIEVPPSFLADIPLLAAWAVRSIAFVKSLAK